MDTKRWKGGLLRVSYKFAQYYNGIHADTDSTYLDKTFNK